MLHLQLRIHLAASTFLISYMFIMVPLPGTNTCSQCPAGSYSDSAGSGTCAMCPAGLSSVWVKGLPFIYLLLICYICSCPAVSYLKWVVIRLNDDNKHGSSQCISGWLGSCNGHCQSMVHVLWLVCTPCHAIAYPKLQERKVTLWEPHSAHLARREPTQHLVLARFLLIKHSK